MGKSMYTLVATIYEVGEHDRVTAVIWAGEQETGEPLCSAHLDLVPWTNDSESRHDVILRHFRTVCDELAENLAEPLF
jgi:hypothetical protein